MGPPSDWLLEHIKEVYISYCGNQISLLTCIFTTEYIFEVKIFIAMEM
jgi:hypothetical protein